MRWAWRGEKAHAFRKGHAHALRELCRVTADTVVVMVSNRTGALPFILDLELAGELFPAGCTPPDDPLAVTRGLLADGVEQYPPDVRDALGAEGRLLPPDYTFTPDELCALFDEAGFDVTVLGGPGALARSLRAESLQRVLDDPVLFERFLDLSMDYDFRPYTLGLGGVNLLAVARRRA